jgi:Tol biopolymer transport system component
MVNVFSWLHRWRRENHRRSELDDDAEPPRAHGTLMALTSGTRLGPYEIVALVGAGGMGEVYKARDTRLKREVALKVLPAGFSQDPDRLARFQREAELLATLNHPNIAHIHGLEEADGIRALVMELVDGPTLADRIAQSPLPITDALPIATQIAEALEAAHEQGVIHRDLKPANIKVRNDGMVKVLDFGLAKALDPVTSSTVNPTMSPTLSMQATMAGVILGTAAYMSPEQAAGKPVDKRTDVWSFGVVLWEMLTGRRLFDGETISHTLADVLRADIHFNKLPKDTPTAIRDLLRRCLDRDTKNRLRDIGEARIALNNTSKEPIAPVSVVKVARLRRALPWTAAGVATVVALIPAVAYAARPREEPRTLKMSVLPPERATFMRGAVPAVSPDGRHLAFVATLDGKDELWVRDLDSLAARPLRGTDGATFPFWKPDSRVIAFFASGKLKKIDVGGGPALSLYEGIGTAFGGSWNKNDVIVFASSFGNGLFRVPAAGGKATPLTTFDTSRAENSHRYPWFLPDGEHVLYTARSSDAEGTSIYVVDLGATSEAHTRRLVVTAASNAVYSAPGYVLFMREQTLMAQPFDVRKTQITGDAVPIAEQVDYNNLAVRGMFSASENGVLAYTSGAGANVQLTWFDRFGTAAGTLGAPGALHWPAISPDGDKVAVDWADQSTGLYDVWLHDLKRGTLSLFTAGPKSNEYPVWSPDGSHLAFYSLRDGPAGHVYQRAIAGADQDEVVLSKPVGEPPRATRGDDWSRDRNYLIEELGGPTGKTGSDIWVLPLFGDRKPFAYLQSPFNEAHAKLSPDGHWLAYVSDETKRNEVYVQTFPAPGGKWPVSTSGGDLPIWSRDGNELFFIGADRKLMAVDVKSRASKDTTGKDVVTFEAGMPKALFGTRLGAGTWYDVDQKGRFLMPTELEQAATVPMTIVVNWTAGLKR